MTKSKNRNKTIPLKEAIAIALEQKPEDKNDGVNPEDKNDGINDDIISNQTDADAQNLDIDISGIRPEIDNLKTQIHSLNVQNTHLKNALELTNKQITQILSILQNLIIKEQTQSQQEQKQEPQSHSHSHPSSITQVQTKLQPQSQWLQIFKEFKESLQNLAYIIQQSQQFQMQNQQVDNTSPKELAQSLKIFSDFTKMYYQMRTWALQQVLTDPSLQMELVNNERFNRMIHEKIIQEKEHL